MDFQLGGAVERTRTYILVPSLIAGFGIGKMACCFVGVLHVLLGVAIGDLLNFLEFFSVAINLQEKIIDQ